MLLGRGDDEGCGHENYHMPYYYTTVVAPSSDTDIFEAVKQDNVDMLTEVISKQKVSVTVTDKDGATPLMYAARKGNIKVSHNLYYIM